MENGKNGYIKWLISSIGVLISIGIWVGTLQSTVSTLASEINVLKNENKELHTENRDLERNYQKEIKEINEKLYDIKTNIAVIAARMP